jgi:hypothetical protein
LRREARNTDRGRSQSGLPGRSHGGWAVSIADIDVGLEHRRDCRTDLVGNDRDSRNLHVLPQVDVSRTQINRHDLTIDVRASPRSIDRA